MINFLLDSQMAPLRVPEGVRVVDMQDGGMGGIRVVGPGTRRFGKELVKAEYVDTDGVLVSISLNVDDADDFYELDFWKVDFSPLKRYPNPQHLTSMGNNSDRQR